VCVCVCDLRTKRFLKQDQELYTERVHSKVVRWQVVEFSARVHFSCRLARDDLLKN